MSILQTSDFESRIGYTEPWIYRHNQTISVCIYSHKARHHDLAPHLSVPRASLESMSKLRCG
ncbi:hypothetical protein CY34DRAFT_798075 [Suillus luteus UH-Slu-Lm8-n1]|uniref:Uncharacterized protein n=1 Tax=Suillus luteus UH-Slu-Lm8-n1 TaxID=930992 RepID=A0A0D0BSD4_9AGAM|nr:hypothetical protein CY34DRAFT_798075 [Suillus luteus UH-Slu-Lm8-n1]